MVLVGIPSASSVSSGGALAPLRVLKIQRRRGRLVRDQALDPEQVAETAAPELERRVHVARPLEDPLGAGDVVVIHQQHVGLQGGLARRRLPVLGDEVAPLGVIEQIGAQIRGFEEERGSIPACVAKREGRPVRARGDVAVVRPDLVAAAREAVDLGLLTACLSPRSRHQSRRSRRWCLHRLRRPHLHTPSDRANSSKARVSFATARRGTYHGAASVTDGVTERAGLARREPRSPEPHPRERRCGEAPTA